MIYFLIHQLFISMFLNFQKTYFGYKFLFYWFLVYITFYSKNVVWWYESFQMCSWPIKWLIFINVPCTRKRCDFIIIVIQIFNVLSDFFCLLDLLLTQRDVLHFPNTGKCNTFKLLNVWACLCFSVVSKRFVLCILRPNDQIHKFRIVIFSWWIQCFLH